MNADLFQYIYNHPLIKNDDLKEIVDAHQKIKFSKGDLILECGKMANEYYLIEDGLLRVYVHDYNGNEITTDFHATKGVSIEVSSLFQRKVRNISVMLSLNYCQDRFLCSTWRTSPNPMNFRIEYKSYVFKSFITSFKFLLYKNFSARSFIFSSNAVVLL